MEGMGWEKKRWGLGDRRSSRDTLYRTQIRLPIFLQDINADFSSGRNIWVKYFCEEEAFRRRLRIVFAQDELHAKKALGIGSSDGTFD